MIRKVLTAALIAAFTLGTTPGFACTGISLKAGDGAAIRGRTLEFGFPMQSKVLVIPAGREMSGTLPDGGKGLIYTTRYAIVGANALKAMPTGAAGMQSSMPVTYIESKKVAEAFAKGAVLVGEDERMMHANRNYMVHASHREAAGVAEVHELDTDIIYVLKGTATFVTGGTAVDTKTIAPHEIRGTTIKDGETRQIVPGDVIIVPNGVPHWFKEVPSPLDYYVVKVR